LIINELLQWAVLLFMGVFLFGLTRQLGNFLVSGRDRADIEAGPEIGKRLPAEVLTGDARERLKALMAERGESHAVLFVVGEECSACHGLLESLREADGPDRMPVATIAHAAGDEYMTLLESSADVVSIDGDGLKKAELVATPFALVVDDDLRVVHKQLAWRYAEVLQGWDHGNGNGATPVVVETGGGRG
jgi:hypothetical protein